MQRFLIAMMLLGATPAGAQSLALNDSGQTRCSDGSGVALACTTALGVLEDASIGRDVAAAENRLAKTGAGLAGFDFTKLSNTGNPLPASAALGAGPNDWACTRDNVTGLVWWIGGVVGQWAEGPVQAASLNAGAGTCGRTDWRVPRAAELQGLVSFDYPQLPNLDTTFFPSQFASGASPVHWAADGYQNQTFGYQIVFNGGSIGIDAKTNSHRINAVSGAGAAPPSLTSQGDGTVLDARTGLVFTQCGIGATAVGASCTGSATLFAWQAAVDEVAARNAAQYLGHADWRLPNVKELTSISVVPTMFVGSDILWTSTSYPSFQTSAMAVDLAYGFGYDAAKTQTRAIRLVRAGGAFADALPTPSLLFASGFE